MSEQGTHGENVSERDRDKDSVLEKEISRRSKEPTAAEGLSNMRTKHRPWIWLNKMTDDHDDSGIVIREH